MNTHILPLDTREVIRGENSQPLRYSNSRERLTCKTTMSPSDPNFMKNEIEILSPPVIRQQLKPFVG